MDTLETLIRRECAVADELVAVIVIQCDEIIHTDDNPECDDPDCICHWERATQNEADIYGTHSPSCDCGWCSSEEGY